MRRLIPSALLGLSCFGAGLLFGHFRTIPDDAVFARLAEREMLAASAVMPVSCRPDPYSSRIGGIWVDVRCVGPTPGKRTTYTFDAYGELSGPPSVWTADDRREDASWNR